MFSKLYFIALPIFFALDMLWLGVIAKNLYRQQIGFLMAPNVNWLAAIIFYLLFIAGLVTFVISPALTSRTLLQTIALGAFFGLVTYATYDLTSLATTKNWPLTITIIDLAWGSFLGAAVSGITYVIASRVL